MIVSTECSSDFEWVKNQIVWCLEVPNMDTLDVIIL